MKIKINEDQYSKLQVHQVKDSVDKKMSDMKGIGQMATKLYNRLSFVTVSEVLSDEINLNKLETDTTNLEEQLTVLEAQSKSFLDNITNDEYEEHLNNLDLAIEDAVSKEYKKLSAIKAIVKHLKEISNLELNKQITDRFPDNNPIEIG